MKYSDFICAIKNNRPLPILQDIRRRASVQIWGENRREIAFVNYAATIVLSRTSAHRYRLITVRQRVGSDVQYYDNFDAAINAVRDYFASDSYPPFFVDNDL